MTDVAAVNFQIPVDAEAEDLDIEFKRALPLKENAGKAKLAKEICALSNHGGGWIVLGREDDGTYPEALPVEIEGAGQDTINQIAATYLQPAPHCSVRWVKPPDAAFEVLVVRVPPVGAAPVCGRKNGPDGENGGTVGVRKGVHYIRKSGPVSAAIESPDEWQTVIRRCVLSDKSALLGALTTMIEKPSILQDSVRSTLDDDIEYILGKWREFAERHPYAVNLSQHFICYGFHLVDAGNTTVSRLRNCLRARQQAAESSHTFFDDRYNAPHEPHVIENAGVDGVNVFAATDDFDQRFAWRLSEALTGVEVISYWEDTAWIKSAVEDRSSRTWERGRKIWVAQQVHYTNSFLTNVKHFCDYFEHAGRIRICVIFSGLEGRSLDSPRSFSGSGQEVRQNTKRIEMDIHGEALAPEARSATIASIVQQINKLAQAPELTAARVAKYLDERS